MNIHVFLNQGMRPLFDEFFLPSLRATDPALTVVQHELSVPAATDFGTPIYTDILVEKTQAVVKRILPQEQDSEFIIISDADIQFFQPVEAIIRAAMVGQDIVFQSEYGTPDPAINAGFYCCRPGSKPVEAYLTEVLRELVRRRMGGGFVTEQSIITETLPHSKVRWGHFPDEIATMCNRNINFGTSDIRRVRLHHANCTQPRDGRTSLDLKLEQMTAVRTSYHQHAHEGAAFPHE